MEQKELGTEQIHQSEQELAEGYYWYEAIFLDGEEIQAAFQSVSEDYPKYNVSPLEYHVTTGYKPDLRHEDLYGSPVIIHITGYTYGAVSDTDEDVVSYNEGFIVEVTSPDEKMQELIDSIDRVWHITGSYTYAAKYTGQLDFSDVTPVDLTIKGVFGLADSEGKLILEYEGLNEK